MKSDSNNPLILTKRALRAWPLPLPDAGGDKEGRGRVLIVGGSTETPGAVLLAAEAALAGGRGQAAAGGGAEHRAAPMAMAVPEARVFGLPETADGEIAPEAAARVAELAGAVQSVAFGPGMIAEDNAAQLMRGVLPRLRDVVVVLDAAAMTCVQEERAALHHLGGPRHPDAARGRDGEHSRPGERDRSARPGGDGGAGGRRPARDGGAERTGDGDRVPRGASFPEPGGERRAGDLRLRGRAGGADRGAGGAGGGRRRRRRPGASRCTRGRATRWRGGSARWGFSHANSPPRCRR